MSGACVMWAFTPVGDVDVLGLVPYPLAEGQACPPDALQVLDSATVQQLTDGAQSGGSNQLPPAEELSAAWGASFVLVVGCYVIARQVGAVVNFLK